MKNVNINTIAKEAGVSRTTVSRVINESGYVNYKTKLKVREVIQKYGYIPSNMARNLSKGKSDIIGIVIPEIENPFFGEILKVISQKTEENGLSIICFNSNNDPEEDVKALATMRNYRVKGLVYTPAIDYRGDAQQRQISSLLDRLDAPVVILDRRLDFYKKADGVYFDNAGASYQATKSLIEAGHKKIAIINAELDRVLARERQAGYLAALKKYGIPLREDYIFLGDYSIEKSYAFSRNCLSLEDRPTAVLTCNNFTSLGFLKALSETNLTLNRDITCVGFDRLNELEMMGIVFNYIERNTEEMGRKTIEYLMQRLTFPDRPYIDHIIKVKLVLRSL